MLNVSAEKIRKSVQRMVSSKPALRTPLAHFGTITDFRLNNSVVFTPFNECRARYPEVLSSVVLGIIKKEKMYGSAPFTIGISGPRNASKSYTGTALVKLLSSYGHTEHIAMESYFKPEEYLKTQGIDIKLQPRDPAIMDFKRLRSDMIDLLNGEEIVLQTRDRFKPDYRGEVKHIEGNKLRFLIVEGISALLSDQAGMRTIMDLFDLKVHLNISPIEAEKRLFVRPEIQRSLGLTTQENVEIYDRFRKVDLPRFTTHYSHCRSNADVVAYLNYWADKYSLSSLVFSEDTICRML